MLPRNSTNKVVLLLISIIVTGTCFSQQIDNNPPEISASEAKISFRDIPYLKEAYFTASPVSRKDGIPVGEMGVDGGNKAMILKLAREIGDNKYGNYDGLLISYKKKLVFESYYKKGRVNLPHFQASATKAYTSLLLGRIIQLGYLTMDDLDKPLVSFLKDLDSAKFPQGVEKITLHKALTMSSGLTITEEQLNEFRKNPAKLRGQNQAQIYLENSDSISSDSQIFSYKGVDPDLIMQVIEAVVPGTAHDFIKDEFLHKIGITNYRWQTGDSGFPEAGGLMYITLRDMLKLGTLVFNKGKWEGEQLISSTYLNKALTGVTTATEEWHPENYQYGYFWYQINVLVDDKNYKANLAWGGGGQRIIVIEALDLIIAITGHDRADKIMTEVLKVIIPAFSVNDFPTIEDRYLGQRPPGLIAEIFAPGIIATEEGFESSVTFSPDMKKIYFTKKGGKYEKRTPLVIQYENNKWGNESITDIQHPIFSKDGKIIYKGNKYRERTHSGWSELKSMGKPFTDKHIMGISVSDKGTFYFDQFAPPDTIGAISYSRLKDGTYLPRQKLGKEINAGSWIAHPYIAPDESYLIWDAVREDGYGDGDLYISFRQKDGSW